MDREEQDLRFGLTRRRQIIVGPFLALLTACLVVTCGADLWIIAIPIPIAAALAFRAYRTRLSIAGDHFVVHRMRSPVSVPVADVVAIGFAHGEANMPRPFVLRTRDGRNIKSWAVSHSRRYLELPSDGRTNGERRVDDFLRAAAIPLTVQRDIDQTPTHGER